MQLYLNSKHFILGLKQVLDFTNPTVEPFDRIFFGLKYKYTKDGKLEGKYLTLCALNMFRMYTRDVEIENEIYNNELECENIDNNIFKGYFLIKGLQLESFIKSLKGSNYSKPFVIHLDKSEEIRVYRITFNYVNIEVHFESEISTFANITEVIKRFGDKEKQPALRKFLLQYQLAKDIVNVFKQKKNESLNLRFIWNNDNVMYKVYDEVNINDKESDNYATELLIARVKDD